MGPDLLRFQPALRAGAADPELRTAVLRHFRLLQDAVADLSGSDDAHAAGFLTTIAPLILTAATDSEPGPALGRYV